MAALQYLISSSYGNDSVALIQWVAERELPGVVVQYSDTGWAAPWWRERVEQGEEFAKSCGFETVRLAAQGGFEGLVRRRKGFPRQGMQFCTSELKMATTLAFLEERDPEGLATVMVGVRREESQARANVPEFEQSVITTGWRSIWRPLAAYTSAMRDELLRRAGFEPLPHRSDECFPCINSNRSDIRRLAEHPQIISKIRRIENDMGHTSKGSPITMFHPYRHMGATGIDAIVKWGLSERGKFSLEDGTGKECTEGFCGI